MAPRVPSVAVAIFLGATAALSQPSPTQSPMQCTISSVPANSRTSGHAELVGDMVLTCNGGTPTPVGQPIPLGTIAIVLDTPVTSRMLSSSWSEALLLVDEPGPGTQ